MDVNCILTGWWKQKYCYFFNYLIVKRRFLASILDFVNFSPFSDIKTRINYIKNIKKYINRTVWFYSFLSVFWQQLKN